MARYLNKKVEIMPEKAFTKGWDKKKNGVALIEMFNKNRFSKWINFHSTGQKEVAYQSIYKAFKYS